MFDRPPAAHEEVRAGAHGLQLKITPLPIEN
jgi:hypothetical protein